MTDMKKLFNLTALTLGAVIYLVAASGGAAQSGNCGPRDMVVERLASGFGETRQSVGLGANNAIVEVFASIETGTWSITITAPGGLTCLVASGGAFESLAERLPAQGKDA